MNLLALILAALAIMGSPGPSTMSATAVAAAYGFGRSLPYAAGLIAGTGVVLLAVAAGIVALVLSVPHAAPVLVAVSALYILYLAWQIATAPPLAARGDGPAEAPGWIGGFLLAVANPKAFVAIAAVFAGTTVVPDDPGLDAIMKTAVLAGMIVLIHLGWLLVGAALSRALQHPSWSRAINVTLAAVLVATTALTVLG
jgi:threonine/homoserine/homoserine lactone efflux protein